MIALTTRSLWTLCLKSIVILVLASVFVQCQQDDSGPIDHAHDHDHAHLTAAKTVTASDIPEVMDFLDMKSGGTRSFTLEGRPGTRQPDLEIDEVHTEDILTLTNEHDRSSYSFRASKDGSEEFSIVNLVVKESATETYGYFLKYTPDTDWLATQTTTFNLSDYSGRITVYDMDGHYLAESEFLNGVETNKDLVDCTNNSNTNNNNSNSSSSSSSSNSNSNTSNSSNSNNNSNTGGHNINILTVCGCAPQHPGGSANASCNCTLADLVIVSIGNKSVQSAVRSVEPCPPDCFQPNGDPCEFGCDSNGECLPDPNDPINQNQNSGTNFDLGLAMDCNKLQNLSNSPSYQQRMAELIANNSGNTEKGYYGRNDSNGNMVYNSSDGFEGEPDSGEIQQPLPSSPVDSYIHNHSFYINIDGETEKPLPFFSGADLYTLYILFEGGYVNDPSDFVMVVTTPGQNISDSSDDTLYAIIISDIDVFINNGNFFFQRH